MLSRNLSNLGKSLVTYTTGETMYLIKCLRDCLTKQCISEIRNKAVA